MENPAEMTTMTVPRRRLGNSGATVSALGLGCMAMTETYSASAADDVESIRTIHRALELGIDFLDTADGYGLGRNEELLARALADRRDRAFLATKIGNVKAGDGKYLGVDGSAAYVKAACEASLRRLNVASIDLLYLHRVDAKTPIEETVGAMGELVAAGKVRYLGLSEVSPETLRRAYAVHPIAALQSEFSLWTRDVETDGVLAAARELGVGFVAYCPLGRGFLTGRFRSPEDLPAKDSRRDMPRFSAGNFAANLHLADAIAALAKRKGCSAPQLALAWLLRHDNVVPIPGTKTVVHLEDNAGAAGVRLDDDDLAEIDAAMPPGAAAGERKAPWGMQLVGL
jgi:aryl-alcohol dehydrogenase-like predicted oxidoreductase